VHQQAVQVLEVQVSTDVVVQVIVILHVKSGKWVQMQRCRGAEVVMWCRGAEVQRCRGGAEEMVESGADVVHAEGGRWCRGG